MKPVIKTKEPNTEQEHLAESPVKKFRCKLCGKEFGRNTHLVHHVRIHTGEAPFICDLCGRSFRCADWLKMHSNVHTSEKRKNLKNYVCGECGKKFPGSTSLQSHQYKHRGERPFACAHCDKKFFTLKPELIEPFVPGWGERYFNNVNYVKNNVFFEPPSMRACSSTPPKQNQDFVKRHNRTPLINFFFLSCIHKVQINHA
uniref:C2H2-type domain-containing protein n=1 Tax=Sinocyclocheilus rhinocerous TaxID=307959 RepID=A0A673J951_9TELE